MKYLILVTAVIMSFYVNTAFATPANPSSYSEVQPDGTIVKLHIRGDEHFQWEEDTDQFTVVRKNGWIEYAILNSKGNLVSSGVRAGSVDPRSIGLTKRTLPTGALRRSLYSKAPGGKGKGGGGGTGDEPTLPSAADPIGTVNNLVVLIRFADHTERSIPSESDIDVLMNALGGHPDLARTGSLRDLYLKQSYGQLTINSTVAAWVTVSKPESYYANEESGLTPIIWEALREALDLVNESVDFTHFDGNGDGKIDSITFLHSGYAAEFGNADVYGATYRQRIWSHRWAMEDGGWTSSKGIHVSDYHISPSLWGTTGSRIGRIGVIAHETGHFFGLPDLYDTDSRGNGIGNWGLMANSWGFSGSQLCPPTLSAWSKMQLGWSEPTELLTSGEYTVRDSGEYNEYYKVSSGFPEGEYLLIENRQQAGYNCLTDGAGLAIFHIDEHSDFNSEGWPTQRGFPRNHYRVALIQADGNYYLELGQNRGDTTDLFRMGNVTELLSGDLSDEPISTDAYQSGSFVNTGNTIRGISASSAEMSFCYNCDAATDPEGLESPTRLTATEISTYGSNSTYVDIELFWEDNSSNETEFVIERCSEYGKGKDKYCNFSEIATVGSDVTQFIQRSTRNNYRYRVKARNDTAESGYSNTAELN